MKEFMGKDFLLESETAKRLFCEYAKNAPVIDFHNHLDAGAILNDIKYTNIAEVWLGGDHYKWRAMRANGVPERLITGEGKPYEKFMAWADTVQNAIGNPLYHWTHLELQRYFGVYEPLNMETAEMIWKKCNEKLNSDGYSVRGLLRMQKVKVLCTTDDPADSLDAHRQLKESDFEIKVLPTFRPEKAMGIGRPGFAEYIGRLEQVCGRHLGTVGALMEALKDRMDFFVSLGCRVSDHSIEQSFYKEAAEKEADDIYRKALKGNDISEAERAVYLGFLLKELGMAYADRGMVMQLHIGALRNNSERMYQRLGADTGYDGIGDRCMAQELSGLLSVMDREERLPRTILYYLNPKDAELLSVMAGCFNGNESGIRGKVQVGTAWWFCDHKRGMEHQMEVFAESGLLSTFVGMLTDSRSFLSFPRHEYFRRILCNLIGGWAERGECPKDMEYLGHMVRGICGENAERFFGF